MNTAKRSRAGVVIGGSGGIGSAAASRLAAAGLGRLVLVFRSDEAAAAEAAASVSRGGCEVVTLRADLTTESGVADLTECVARVLGDQVDVLVYAAVHRSLGSALDHDPAEWRRTMDVGVDGFLRAAAALAPRMPHGGRIIAISGLSGIRAYSTMHLRMGVAKAALQHASRYLALELAPRGVTVNVVAFGSVLTAGVADDLDTAHYEALVTRAAERIPMGHTPWPDEVVGVIGFLASPDSQWMTGQVLIVDGGESLR